MLTTEQLLTPRVVVANLWPGCLYEKGDVLEKRDGFYLGYEITRPYYEYAISIDDIESNTANFRKLNWWEERDTSDLPEYVKVFDKYYKVEWVNSTQHRLSGSNNLFNIEDYPTHYLPATESEYTEFINRKK
jgi:hypothetical protein